MTTTEIVHHPRTFGCRTETVNGDRAQNARSADLAHRTLLKAHHRHGHLWITRRIKTETQEIDPHWAREDQVVTETTYSYRITRAEQLAAPLIRRARWYASLGLARLAYSRDLHARAKANPEGLPGKFHDLVVRTRRSPNVLDDGELYAVLKVPIYEWARGEHR
jgi:hypothetical protein